VAYLPRWAAWGGHQRGVRRRVAPPSLGGLVLNHQRGARRGTVTLTVSPVLGRCPSPLVFTVPKN
jgi:hypothetical protein